MSSQNAILLVLLLQDKNKAQKMTTWLRLYSLSLKRKGLPLREQHWKDQSMAKDPGC